MQGRYHASLESVIDDLQLEATRLRDRAANITEKLETDSLRQGETKIELRRDQALARGEATGLEKAIEQLQDIDPLAVHRINKVRMPDNLCRVCGMEQPPVYAYCEFSEDCHGEQEWEVTHSGLNSIMKRVCTRHVTDAVEYHLGGATVKRIAQHAEVEQLISDAAEGDPGELDEPVEPYEHRRQRQLNEMLVEELIRDHEEGNHNIPSEEAMAKTAGCPTCNLPHGSRGQV